MSRSRFRSRLDHLGEHSVLVAEEHTPEADNLPSVFAQPDVGVQTSGKHALYRAARLGLALPAALQTSSATFFAFLPTIFSAERYRPAIST